jgi:hypothetical protein
MNEVVSLLTSSLNIHLNIGQNMIINTSQVFMSLETTAIESLSNKLLKLVGNGQIQLPKDFNSNIINNRRISIRVSLVFFFVSCKMSRDRRQAVSWIVCDRTRKR